MSQALSGVFFMFLIL